MTEPAVGVTKRLNGGAEPANGEAGPADGWRTGQVTVRAPATSANLGPGFDSFGLCLDLADVVTAEVAGRGTEIEVRGEGADTVARGDAHLVVAAIRRAFEGWRLRQPGLRLVCRNAIPHGRGLGSSAAAIVAGTMLAGALARRELTRPDLVEMAADMEGHADNVAACVLGGLAVAWTSGGHATAIRLDVVPSVVPVVLCSQTSVGTPAARELIPPTVAHEAASANAASAALLVVALTSRPELLLAATTDRLHQEARRSVMPDSLQLVDRLRAVGVAAVLSGAGPSVLALATGDQVDQVAGVAAAAQADWRVMALDIDPVGAALVGSP